MNKIEKEFILKFLNQEEIEKGVFSNLMTALNDVRKICGIDDKGIRRNIGLYNENQYLNPNSLVAIITYFSILDLMGTIFKSQSRKKILSNNIKNTLHSFSTLAEEEINILVSLRNSITHNFSLVSYNKKTNPIEVFHFTLEHFSNGRIIKKTKSLNKTGNSTDSIIEVVINTNELINLVEEIRKRIIEEYENDKIDLRLSLSEIKSKFTFSI